MKKILFFSTIFLSAFLLFQIQPMIAKMILPWFGGSAAVWITAMLFFQTTLLGGYLYAHWAIKKLSPKTQAGLHAFLLGVSFLFLPVSAAVSWKPSGAEEPVLRILGLLTVSVGLPYFLLSTTSPLLQAWYARTFQKSVPYRLFGLSNFASLIGLLVYPFLIEPAVTLRGQSLGWSAAYGIFSLLCAGAAFASARKHAPEPGMSEDSPEEEGAAAPKFHEKLVWFLLAGAASTLLLAVTNHLTQNVASIPFLWIVPLSLYLLTFILCFDYEQFYRPKLFTWLFMAALGAMAYGLASWTSHTSLKIVIPVFSGGLFLCCMFCHGELVRRKPAPAHLTSFYVMLSLGGALGGVLVGLASPKVLPGYFELTFALAFCAALLFLIPMRQWRITATASMLVFVGVGCAGYLYIHSYRSSVRVMARNFYGGLRVLQYDSGTEEEARVLVHGTVNHGMQYTAPERRKAHVTYYGPHSGVALAITAKRPAAVKVGVIGLGAGSLASFGKPGDLFRFYDINPLVETLARTEFSYLADSPAKSEVVIGDGRLLLEGEAPQHYDVLAVDAFSGDSIPVHLLTREALELYFRHLKPDGILALHTTNTHLKLGQIVEVMSRTMGKSAVLIENDQDSDTGVFGSDWVLLASKPFTSAAILNAAAPLPSQPGLRIWTDDYSNLFQVLKK